MESYIIILGFFCFLETYEESQERFTSLRTEEYAFTTDAENDVGEQIKQVAKLIQSQ